VENFGLTYVFLHEKVCGAIVNKEALEFWQQQRISNKRWPRVISIIKVKPNCSSEWRC
jgi:hypothetical protein